MLFYWAFCVQFLTSPLLSLVTFENTLRSESGRTWSVTRLGRRPFAIFYYRQFWRVLNALPGLVWTTGRDLQTRAMLQALQGSVCKPSLCNPVSENILECPFPKLDTPRGLLFAEVHNTWPEICSNNFSGGSFSSEFLFPGYSSSLRFRSGKIAAFRSVLLSESGPYRVYV